MKLDADDPGANDLPGSLVKWHFCFSSEAAMVRITLRPSAVRGGWGSGRGKADGRPVKRRGFGLLRGRGFGTVRQKAAVSFLRLEREPRSPICERPENSPADCEGER